VGLSGQNTQLAKGKGGYRRKQKEKTEVCQEDKVEFGDEAKSRTKKSSTTERTNQDAINVATSSVKPSQAKSLARKRENWDDDSLESAPGVKRGKVATTKNGPTKVVSTTTNKNEHDQDSSTSSESSWRLK
jgi:hypothetical protein